MAFGPQLGIPTAGKWRFLRVWLSKLQWRTGTRAVGLDTVVRRV